MLFTGQTMVTTLVILHVKTGQHILQQPTQQRGHSMKAGAATLPALLPNV